jgi:hypothetical protein
MGAAASCEDEGDSSTATISSRGGDLLSNLLYSPIEEEGAFSLTSNPTEVTL